MVPCGACNAKNFIPGDLPPMETLPCTKCGHPVMIPVRMRQFELRAVIASGGMGTVFKAYDLALTRHVALKMLKKEMAEDKEVMEAFYREARASASLNHTNIIHIYTFDEYEQKPYLVMELADQGSLDSWITRGRVPELNVLDIGIKMASALTTALKHNLLHRDIKPGNILFNSEGEPKLVDFGLARSAEGDTEYSEDNTVWGTPDYVAPEKIRQEPETFHSDMYSLCATLYHALTGRPPFEAETTEALVQAHVDQPVLAPMDLVQDITKQSSDAILIGLNKLPKDRFATYDDLHMALEAARSQLLIQRYSSAEE
ncbi:MAG: Serine/threonine protein kinase [Verrucomicrobiales bacterium]|nr:Serine/threonine protein kinase [Verrucomicrobiales bacterium]